MKGTDYAANKYSVFKHFAKYIRPGSVRLETQGSDATGVYVSAFADDQTKTLTSVLINTTNETQEVTLKLNGISLSQFKTAFASTEAFTWKALRAYRVSHGQVTIRMPAESIFTLAGSTNDTAAAKASGRIVGVYFDDRNQNGTQDKGETGLGGDKVFLDLNANGTRDKREPTAVTDSNGRFLFAGLAGGIYRVRREVVSGYTITTPPGVSRINRSKMNVTGVYLGVATASSSGVHVGAAISGHTFGDTNGNGRQDSGESNAAGKVIYLDANNNGKFDSGEKKTTSDAGGNFTFTALPAGTYRVRRIFPKGYQASTTPITLTLADSQKKTGLLIGGQTA
jgi:hypothetical protein